VDYHHVDPNLPRALRRALRRAERTAYHNGRSIRPWRQSTPSPHVTLHQSACYKCPARVEVLSVDHGGDILPTVAVVHKGTEARIKPGTHPFGSGW
jgi:hypothetical protein